MLLPGLYFCLYDLKGLLLTMTTNQGPSAVLKRRNRKGLEVIKENLLQCLAGMRQLMPNVSTDNMQKTQGGIASMGANMMTIDQVAKLLDVSKDTVRRRIKIGELIAEKHDGPYGLQWMLPEEQFDQARMIHEVVPVTRSVNVAELQALMSQSVSAVVSKTIQEETQGLRSQIESLKEQLAAQQETTAAHQQRIEELLKEQQQSKGSLLSRLFG